jgi:addiction module HigA family antidote
MDEEMMLPIHPGEILLHEFLLPMGMTARWLALCIGVDPRRIHDIIQGKRSVTADTALRLRRFFNVSPEIWMDLQTKYDLEMASLQLKDRLEAEVRPCPEGNTLGRQPRPQTKPRKVRAQPGQAVA